MLVFLLVASASLPLVNVFPLDGQNKGCAHDGKEVDVGETLVVGCDTCTCIPGVCTCIFVVCTCIVYIWWLVYCVYLVAGV